MAPYTEYTLEAPNLQRLLREKQIRMYTLHWVEKIEVNNTVKVTAFDTYRDGYRITLPPKTGEMPRPMGTEVTEIACDSVILVTQRTSDNALYKALHARKGEWAKNGLRAVYRIGDCHTPRLIQLAIFEGHRLAREFEAENPQTPRPYIRERQIWGSQTYPEIGARG